VAILTSAGGYAAVRQAHVEGDPGWVVIDEFAGQFLAMVSLPNTAWQGLFFAFILFRILDITKLGPIGWADRRKGALGIMADDVVAGLITAVALWLGRLIFPALLI
jgi:phosphatidylglycerophosphatase A